MRPHGWTLSWLLLLGACDAPLSRVQAMGQEGWKTDFSKHTVPLAEIVSGGPPKDGIPAIDQPRFIPAREADLWLSDREPVALVELNGEAKAYPLQILIWHEIVNDQVGGTPVAVTFCPLCNTTLAFERRFEDRLLDFGTTGRLRHSDLVMYDRQTETWWQQATGEGLVGELAGKKLSFVSAPVVSWREAKALPGLQVLSRDTGFERDYGRNPYVGYDRRGSPLPAFFSKARDERLPAMERVVALERRGEALALPFTRLQERRVAHVELADEGWVVFWAPGTASVLDQAELPGGRDVGSSGVFRRTAGGKRLTFAPAGEGRFKDRETGSVWNVLGEALSGPLSGHRLEPVPHGNHFWFAWVAFQPETRIWDG